MNKQNLINMRADDISRTLVNLTRDIRRNRELSFESGLDEELNDIETLTGNIKELYNYCNDLSNTLNEMSDELNSGALSWENLMKNSLANSYAN